MWDLPMPRELVTQLCCRGEDAVESIGSRRATSLPGGTTWPPRTRLLGLPCSGHSKPCGQLPPHG